MLHSNTLDTMPLGLKIIFKFESVVRYILYFLHQLQILFVGMRFFRMYNYLMINVKLLPYTSLYKFIWHISQPLYFFAQNSGLDLYLLYRTS